MITEGQVVAAALQVVLIVAFSSFGYMYYLHKNVQVAVITGHPWHYHVAQTLRPIRNRQATSISQLCGAKGTTMQQLFSSICAAVGSLQFSLIMTYFLGRPTKLSIYDYFAMVSYLVGSIGVILLGQFQDAVTIAEDSLHPDATDPVEIAENAQEFTTILHGIVPKQFASYEDLVTFDTKLKRTMCRLHATFAFSSVLLNCLAISLILIDPQNPATWEWICPAVSLIALGIFCFAFQNKPTILIISESVAFLTANSTLAIRILTT